MPTRAQMRDSLGEDVDVLVIGGGIVGCGVARDAARRGLSVVLVEMHDLAFGTSSRSSKLVHGGLRYLEHYEFSLVFEAVSERRILLDIAPHLVNPLGFLFPVYEDSPQKLWLINAGMWVYEGLSLFRSPKRHRSLKRGEIAEEEPALGLEGISGAPLYYDCATDDARLTLENALDAARLGAKIITQAKVVSFIKDASSRVVGVVVEDGLRGGLVEIRAGAVINATGPWTDRTVAMSRALAGGPLLRPTKGIHLVVDWDRLPVNHAVVCFHPSDGRVLFAIPWGEQTYVGTTDTDFEGDPAALKATREDVTYLLEAANLYFPSANLLPDDVLSTWAGLRPLMRPQQGGSDVNESAVSREHQIVVGQDGLITIAGGKLTTFRRMAGEVVDTAVKLLRLSDRRPAGLVGARTDEEPLPGAVGWPEDDDHDRVAHQIVEASEGCLEERTGRLLADTYGMRGLDVARLAASDSALARPIVAGRPEIFAQVVWAVKEEFATSVADVLTRRTQIFYRDGDQGRSVAHAVAESMAPHLGWDDASAAASAEAYLAEVAYARTWRGE